VAELTGADIENILNPFGKKLDLISERVDYGTTGAIKLVNDKLDIINTNLFNLFKVQTNAVKNNAAAVKDSEGKLEPLNKISETMDEMYEFLQETFNDTFKPAVKLVTETLQSQLKKITALLNVQINAVKHDFAEEKAANEAAKAAPEDPLIKISQMVNRVEGKLEFIYGFLKETFTPTGLGSEDDNKGMLEGLKEKDDDPDTLTTEKEKKPKEENKGSAWLAGAVVAATLMSIKSYLEETWVGLAQRFLKPFVAIQLAIKGLPKSLTRLNTGFVKLASNIGKWFTKTFPRATKLINNLMKPIRAVTNAVKGFSGAITSAVKNFKLSKFFAPLTTWLSKLGGTAGFGKLFKYLSPIGGLFKTIALPLTIALEAFEAFNMMFVGSFTKNAEKLADDISEKGVLGRMWYGFTHMFTTIIAAVKTNFDTLMQTFDIAFSDHPDGILGKLKNIGQILVTPIVELFKDFIIYPIQKGLAFLPDWMIKVDDPDDVAAAQEKERAKLGLSYDEEAGWQSSGTGQDVNKSLADHEKRQAERAAKEGLTLPEYKEYVKFIKSGNYKGMRPSGAEWLESKQGKVNQSSELPKPNTAGPYQGQGAPHGQALLQQNAAQYNTTYEVKLPSAGEIINQ